MITLLALLFLSSYIIHEIYWKRRKLPPGPMPLPLIGNVLQLNMKELDVSLRKFQKQFGSIYTIWIPRPAVIICDYETVKETFIKQGEIFAARPYSNLVKLAFGGNYGLIFAEPYRDKRRFSLHVLRDLGFGRSVMQDTIIAQAQVLCEEFLANSKGGTKPIDVQFAFTIAVGNIIHQLIFGYTRPFNDPQLLSLKQTFDTINKHVENSGFLLLELYPWLHQLKHIGIDFGGLSAFKRDMELVFDYVRKEIAEHKATFDESQPPRDYIDAFLLEANKNPSEDFSNIQLVVAVKDLFSAGMETTATILRFAVKYLLEFPEIQEKLQKEIDNKIGNNSDITYADQQKLPNLCAFVQELLRISNILPLNLMHSTTEEVNVGGYTLEKGIGCVLQMANIHMDEKIFENPLSFRPDRFIDKAGQFVRDERVLAFSAGKRSCLGESLARMEIFIFLATCIQKLRFAPNDESKQANIKITSGLLRKPEPFECRISAR